MSNEQNHAERDHAIYAPSARKRWMKCPGSVAMSEGIDRDRSAAAEEGEECHEAAAHILEGASWREATAFLSEEQEWIVEEFTDYCLDLIDRLIEKYGKDGVKVWIEQRVRSAYAGLENNHGTADLCIYAGRRLAVIDLKAGFYPVPIREEDGRPNFQLANYGFLALDHHGLWDDVDDVMLVIFQPRVQAGPLKIIIPVEDLEMEERLTAQAIKKIEAGDKTLNPGEWCRFCPGKTRPCPALRKSAVEKSKLAFDEKGELEKPINYSDAELADIFREAQMIQQHLDGVFGLLTRRLERGKMRGLGFKLVKKRATAKWTKPEELHRGLSDISMGHVLYKDKMLTPNQLATALKKEGIDFDITPFFVKESSGHTLVADSDPREEYTPNPFED